jgi:hypothetical protein
MLRPTARAFMIPLQWRFRTHAAGAIAATVGFSMVKQRLDASYAASGHPVDYMTGQTAFDAATVKGYYAEMEALGTLPIYVQTQIIDFAFLAFFALMGWLWGTMLARMMKDGSFSFKLALFGGAAIVFGASMDLAENLTSFIMLADPQGFASPLAIIYSSFALTKFASIGIGFVAIVASAILGQIAMIYDGLSR